MINRKPNFDEMQVQQRGKIGNQMFMVMFWAIFLNIGLNSAGISWLSSPMDYLIIINACMGIYLVRLIAANAHTPVAERSKRKTVSWAIALVLCIAIAAVAVLVLSQAQVFPVAEGSSDDYSAVILFIGSGICLMIALIMSVIKKRAGAEENEDD